MGISDVVAKAGWRSGDPLTARARVVERHRSTAASAPAAGSPTPWGPDPPSRTSSDTRTSAS